MTGPHVLFCLLALLGCPAATCEPASRVLNADSSPTNPRAKVLGFDSAATIPVWEAGDYPRQSRTLPAEDVTSAGFRSNRYWRFENSTDVNMDSAGAYDLRPSTTNERFSWRTQSQGGLVGGWLEWNGSLTNSSRGPAGWDAVAGSIPLNQTLTPSCAGVTVEFLVKPGPCFMRGGDWEVLRGAGQVCCIVFSCYNFPLICRLGCTP